MANLYKKNKNKNKNWKYYGIPITNNNLISNLFKI